MDRDHDRQPYGGNEPVNGVDSEEIIGKRIGMEHMVYSLMKIASQRTGNQIRYDPEKTAGVFFGEKDCCVSERVKALCRLLDGSGVHYRVCQNVMQDLWYKFSLNISKNLPQAILNAGRGLIQTVNTWHISVNVCVWRWSR